MWFATLFNFLRGKSSNITTIFIGMFVLVFAVFLFSNANVILSKLGFETTTTLKAALTKSQADLETATRINIRLKDKLIDLERENQIQHTAIREYQNERLAVVKVIETVKVKYLPSKDKLSKKLDAETVISDKTIDIPLKELNQLSEINIDTINEVYSSLFKTNNLSNGSDALSKVKHIETTTVESNDDGKTPIPVVHSGTFAGDFESPDKVISVG